MNAKTMLMCGICSLGLFAGRAETYHATEGTLEVKDSTLAVYYPFDDAATLATDHGPNRYGSLKVADAAKPVPEFLAEGKVGGAVSLSKNGFVAETFPSQIPTGSNPFSVCFWFWSKADDTHGRGLVGWGEEANKKVNDIVLRSNKPNSAIWQAFSINTWDTYASVTPESGTLQDGWHSVAVTYDGKERAIYIDGVERYRAQPQLSAWAEAITPNVTAANFQIGKALVNSGGSYYCQIGYMDEVAVFSAALSSDDVTAYHATGVKGVSTAIPDGSTFVADEGATLKLGQYNTVAAEVSGDGDFEADRLTVTDRLAGGFALTGDLMLGDGVAIDASAKKTVSGAVTVLGGATVSLASFPTAYPAYVPVIAAASVAGEANLASWTVAGLPDGVTAAFSTSGGEIDLVLTDDGKPGSVIHATESMTVADNSLAVYYPFDDTATLATDMGPYANGALAVAGTASPVCRPNGAFGGCCQFLTDAGSGYFSAETFPSSMARGSKPFTICLWAKTADPYNSNRPVLAFGTNGGYGSMLELALSQVEQTVAGTTRVNLQFSPSINWATLNGTLPDSGTFGTWHSVVFVFHDGSHELYLDGQNVSSGKLKGGGNDLNPTFGTDFFMIGKTCSGSGQCNNYRGSLDEVAIYNRAFDAADAAAYHAKSVGGVSSTAVRTGTMLVVDEGATLTVNQYNPQTGSVAGAGTVKAAKLTVGGVVGAGVTVDGDLTLGDNVSVECADAPVVVSGTVSIAGAGKVVAANELAEGTYVLMRAAAFSGVDNLRLWRRRVGSMRHVVKVVGNELVLTVVGGGLAVVIE